MCIRDSQDAINAVKDNETIEIVGSSKTLTATVSGNKTFTVNANSNTVTLTAASGYTLTKDAAGKYTVSRQSSGGPGSSGGSISTPTTYAVNVNAATNGAVAADKKTASKGTTVTVTASPSKGYVVDAVKVVDKDGKDVAVTGKDGKYVFTMPGSAVTVTGTFKAETPAPVALPFTDVKSGNWFYDAVKYAHFCHDVRPQRDDEPRHDRHRAVSAGKVPRCDRRFQVYGCARGPVVF